MYNFKDLGIKVATRAFTGEKIKLDRILNKEVTVLHFKIEDSSKKPGTKCLWIQLEVDGVKRVNFTGAQALIEAIQKVPEANFPFKTTIVKENDRVEFS